MQIIYNDRIIEVVEYINGLFCKSIACPEWSGSCNKQECIKTAKHFHQWLVDHDYKIITECWICSGGL